MKKYTVYQHVNKFNGKRYIGITGYSVNQRWGINGRKYLSKRNGSFYQKKFANAILKYGWNNFYHQILLDDVESFEQACIIEKSLIKYFDSINNGYNIASGGEGTPNVEVSKERIQKTIDRCSKKIIQYDLNGNKINEFKSATEAARLLNISNKQISSCCTGKRKTVYGFIWRFDGDEIDKFYYKNDGIKSVVQYSIDGDFIAKYKSIKDANISTGVNSGNISLCCLGEYKSAGGFVWRYEKDSFDKFDSKNNWHRQVLQFTLDGQFIAEYKTTMDAERATGIKHTNISSCCRGKLKRTYGYIWKYKDDNKTNS